MCYTELYGTSSGALCADHKRLLDRIDPLIIEAYRNEDNDAIDALNLEIRTKLGELLDHVRRTSGLEYLTPHADYGFLECAPPADELRDEIRAEIEAHEAGLAGFDEYMAGQIARANAESPDFDREGAEEIIQRGRELILAIHEAKIAELEAKIRVR